MPRMRVDDMASNSVRLAAVSFKRGTKSAANQASTIKDGTLKLIPIREGRCNSAMGPGASLQKDIVNLEVELAGSRTTDEQDR